MIITNIIFLCDTIAVLIRRIIPCSSIYAFVYAYVHPFIMLVPELNFRVRRTKFYEFWRLSHESVTMGMQFTPSLKPLATILMLYTKVLGVMVPRGGSFQTQLIAGRDSCRESLMFPISEAFHQKPAQRIVPQKRQLQTVVSALLVN